MLIFLENREHEICIFGRCEKNLVKPAARYKRYEMSDIVSEKRRMKQNEKKDAVKLYGNCYDIDDCRVVINNGCVL